VVAEPVQLARGLAIRTVFTHAKQQRAHTCPLAAWARELEEILAAGPRHVDLLTADGDWHARRGKRRWLVSHGRPSAPLPAVAALHDRPPAHPLDQDNPAVRALLVAAGLFSPNGQVRGEAAAKYRQVQHYIELLRPLRLWETARQPGQPLRILDAGCGKAYMSLALLLFARGRGTEVELLGVDRNAGVVATAAGIAHQAGIEQAAFTCQPLTALGAEEAGAVDLLVSLHACDTATDDAILAGLRFGASAIVVAPCCHQEVAAQLSGEHAGDPGDAALLRHGIIRQRFGELLTDELRSLALAANGFSVDVLEFVSAEHTHRNLMIRAERTGAAAREEHRAAAGESFAALCGRWHVRPAIAVAT
jgi:SAM-dependent methyltransferase